MQAVVSDLLDRAEKTIKSSKAVDLWRPSDARVQAEELLEAVLDKKITPEGLEEGVPAAKARTFETLVKRRAAGEPVAMITGKTEFLGMELLVRRGVFVPRNSSELLAQKAIERLRNRERPVAIDVATGTGPVALAIANKVSRAKVFGIDIAARPLSLARENAGRLGLRNATFMKSDMLSGLPTSLRGRVDVFTSHPPYVAHAELEELPVEIKKFEPVESLTDRSDDGLGFVRRLAGEAPAWLRQGGWMLIEVSPNLSRRVRGILMRNGFSRVKSHRDSLGATRVVTGALTGKR